MVKMIGRTSVPSDVDPVKYGVRVCFDMAKAMKKIDDAAYVLGISLHNKPATFDTACNYTDIMRLFLPPEVFESDEWFDDLNEGEDFDEYWNKYFGGADK